MIQSTTPRFHVVTDDAGKRIGDAYRRADGTMCVRLDRPVTIPRPGTGSDAVYVYVDPVPSPLVPLGNG